MGLLIALPLQCGSGGGRGVMVNCYYSRQNVTTLSKTHALMFRFHLHPRALHPAS